MTKRKMNNLPAACNAKRSKQHKKKCSNCHGPFVPINVELCKACSTENDTDMLQQEIVEPEAAAIGVRTRHQHAISCQKESQQSSRISLTVGFGVTQEQQHLQLKQEKLPAEPRNHYLNCQNCMRSTRRLADEHDDRDVDEEFIDEMNYLAITLSNVTKEAIVFRRKWCMLKKEDADQGDGIVRLCQDCKIAICKDPTTGSKICLSNIHCWQTFVWSILRDSKSWIAHGVELWSLIPMKWRHWWIDAFVELCNLKDERNVTMEDPPPFFKEVTHQVGTMKKVIDELKIVPLRKAIDRYICVPLVKCPWGCSEYYNLANHVALDLVLDAFFKEREKLLLISPVNSRNHLSSARSNFVKSAHQILYNPDWICSPSIAFLPGKGPIVLTCQEHHKGTSSKYMHPPTNPTGTLISTASDQMAEVVVKSKTIRAVKARKYSDAYQMNRLDGGFDGVDTQLLTDEGRFNINTRLSDRRDSLSLAARPGLVAHVQRMVEEKKIPQAYANQKIHFATSAFPPESLQVIRDEHGSGATFVAIDECIEAELALRREGPSLISLFTSTDATGDAVEACQVYFHPPWPATVLNVHPPDRYGAAFPVMPKLMDSKLLDMRSLWVILATISFVPSVWKVVIKNVTTTNDWYGWVLTYACRQIMKSTPKTGRQCHGRTNPFHSKKKDQELVAEFFDWFYLPCSVASAFSDLSGEIKIVGSSDFYTTDWRDATQNIVLVYHDNNGPYPGVLTDFIRHNSGVMWENQLIVTTQKDGNRPWKGTIYSRHGGSNFPLWWQQHRGDKRVTKFNAPANFPSSLAHNWDVAVYVNGDITNMQELKDQLWVSCGGQLTTRCDTHRDLLVRAPFQTKVACAMCKRNVSIVCKDPNCTIGVCSMHQDQLASFKETYFVTQGTPVDANGHAYQNADTQHEQDNKSEGSDTSLIYDCMWDDTNDGSSTNSTYLDDSKSSSSTDSFFSNIVDKMIHDKCDRVDHRKDTVNATDYEYDVDDDDALSKSSNETKSEPGVINLAQEMVTCNIHDSDDDDNSSDDDGEAGNKFFIPTTNSGRSAPTIDTNTHCIGSRVVFNRFGHLLVRKKQKLLLSRAQQNFLQRIIATTDRTSIPLVYPEASIFPSIFWDQQQDGSILGAIPQCLLSDDATLKRLGFATLHDHMRTRMKDTSLLTSTDHRYHYFALDACINLGMRGQDSRIILSRGFGGNLQGSGGVRALGEPDNLMFDTDSVDNRPVVNRLAAAIGDEMPTVFFTHTCSMATHFGMRVIKAWLESPAALDNIKKSIDPDCYFSAPQLDDLKKDLISSSCGVVFRTFINVSTIYMTYITESPELPIGEVEKVWYRFELQDDEANLPHIHSILWLKDNDGTPEGLEKVLYRIRGSMSSMVTKEEEEEYVQNGIVSSKEELYSMLENLKNILMHKHNRRCMVPVATKTETAVMVDGKVETQYYCKYPDNRMISPNPSVHSFVKIQKHHSKACIEVLQAVSLVAPQLDGLGQPVFLDDGLTATRHIPPTSGDDGIMSPVFGKLWVMNPNSNNVQLTNSIDISSYLAPYAVKSDKGSRIYIKPPSKHNANFQIDTEIMGNTKITAVQLAEAEKESQRRKAPDGRKFIQTEVMMLMFKVPQVVTNIKFIQIPTVPLEERPGFDRPVPVKRLIIDGVVIGAVNKISDLDSHAVIPSHSAQISWDNAERQFKASALVIAQDQLFSPYTVDGVTVFGVRPPELLFVNRQDIYFRWFKRFDIPISGSERNMQQHYHLEEYCRNNLSINLDTCSWIDAASKLVRLRVAALPELMRHLRDAPPKDFGGRPKKKVVEAFFSKLNRLWERENSSAGIRTQGLQELWNTMRSQFLCDFDVKYLPVVWFTPIKPINPTRFLIHVLLSMGSFDNEMELFTRGTFRNAFSYARLFDITCPEESVNELTRAYIMNQLKNQPGGTQQFDRFCVAAYNVFQNALLLDVVHVTDKLPSYLYTHLRQDTQAEVSAHIAESKQLVGQVALEKVANLGYQCLPTIDELMMARKHKSDNPWHALDSLVQGENQTDESMLEQQHALWTSCRAFDDYIQTRSAKSTLFLGDPGSGKTTLVNMSVIHAMARGLNVAMTSVQGERATKEGGTHIHILFAIPVKRGMKPAHMAELAVSHLNRSYNARRLAYIQSLDVLAFDEFGQLSAELLSTLDIIFRRVRDRKGFLGGVMIVASIDICQLKPIEGRPPLMSPLMLGNFQIARLQHSVRAANDLPWQRIQKIARMLPCHLTPELIDEFENLLKECCTFVDDFDGTTFPNTALFVFGTKKARNDMRVKQINELKKQQAFCTSTSDDFESTIASKWLDASHHTTMRLEHACREPHVLHFFAGATYETTYNLPNCFNQGQLVMLLDLPSELQIHKKLPVKVYMSPPGNKSTPRDGVTREELLELGWTEQMVGKAPVIPRSLGRGVSGKREQFALRPRVSATIHNVIGQELPCLVTKISTSDKVYSIWEKAQAIVVTSRTPTAKQTIFVGNRDETARALSAALTKNTQYSTYMDNVVNAMTASPSNNFVPVIDIPAWHPFRPQDVELPKADCVYLLVSCSNPSLTYVGQTTNLRRRIDRHNSGYGSLQTANDCPWGVLAYVVGFNGDEQKRLDFELDWKRQQVSRGSLTANDVADLGKGIILSRLERFPNEQLTFVLAGTVSQVTEDKSSNAIAVSNSQTQQPTQMSQPTSLLLRKHANDCKDPAAKPTTKQKVSKKSKLVSFSTTQNSRVVARKGVSSTASPTRRLSRESNTQAVQEEAVPLGTYQGRIAGSTNGCVGIAPLIVSKHLSNPSDTYGATEEDINLIIDETCIPILQHVRDKNGIAGFGFLEQLHMLSYLWEEELLSEVFSMAGGNIMDDAHINHFISLLQPELPCKAGATFFHQSHYVAILKRCNGDGGIVYDVVESLPATTMEGTRGTRTRCYNTGQLRDVIRARASRYINFQSLDVYNESRFEEDPRTFQTFVWTANNADDVSSNEATNNSAQQQDATNNATIDSAGNAINNATNNASTIDTTNKTSSKSGIIVIDMTKDVDKYVVKGAGKAAKYAKNVRQSIQSTTSTVQHTTSFRLNVPRNILATANTGPLSRDKIEWSMSLSNQWVRPPGVYLTPLQGTHWKVTSGQVTPQEEEWMSQFTSRMNAHPILTGAGGRGLTGLAFVNHRDWASLLPGCFAMDSPIIYFIRKYATNNNVHIFDASFYLMWLTDHDSNSNYLPLDCSATRQVSRRQVYEKPLWILLISHAPASHWQPVVAVSPGLPHCKVYVFDSLAEPPRRCPSNFALLQCLMTQAVNTAIRSSTPQPLPLPQPIHVTFQLALSPQQENGFDCGIFATLNAIHASRNQQDLFTAQEPPNFRHWFSQLDVNCKRQELCNEFRNDILRVIDEQERPIQIED